MKIQRNTQIIICLVLLAALTLLPILGLNEFHTKGEPREAVVSLSMLQQSDWILPTNNGVDIPYKPPFFHWVIAAMASLFGFLNEYISRLPSALSLIVVVASTFAFLVRRTSQAIAVVTALVCLSCFELHRAGTNCRVDMMVSAAMIVATYLLYDWWADRKLKGLPLCAIIAMSVATLTKGPVGMVLPLLCIFVFALIRGQKFTEMLWKFPLIGVLAMVAPALWYVAAYQHGGQQFFDLVWEENVGRFTGTMTYHSHEGPAIINFVNLIAGFLPWTLLMVIVLCFRPWREGTSVYAESPIGTRWERVKEWSKQKWAKVKAMDDDALYCLTCAVVIVGFFCIPKSKRSVYIMPAYPFIAYFVAKLVIYCKDRLPKALRIYSVSLFAIIVLATVGALVMYFAAPSEFDTSVPHKPMAQILHAFGSINLLLLALAIAIANLAYRLFAKHKDKQIMQSVSLSVLLFLLLDVAILPTIQNTHSQKHYAEEIAEIVPDGPIYSFLKTDINPNANMMHYFELDYYLNDRVKLFLTDKPVCGHILVLEKELEEMRDSVFADYSLHEVTRSPEKSHTHHDFILLMRMEKR